MKKVVTRFPPSPTGKFHVGSARTALFNFLYARQNRGEVLLRFEDTDRKRSKKEYEEEILEGLSWLGIQFDGKPTRQSERGGTYEKHLKKLIDEGKAYEAEPSEGGEGAKASEDARPREAKSPDGNRPRTKSPNDDRPRVIRFKNPNKEIVFEDEVRGEISFDTTELGDFVIARNTDEPLYHLTVVVDDFEMSVTHIIRGEDHISNTQRQILIQEAIGAPRPVYAHIPLILAPDRSKLSKRHGAVSISEYRDMGYLPEAMVNYLSLLGWNPGDEREIFSMKELVKEFSLERVQKGGAIFNIEKLNSINSHYIKKLPAEEFIEKILGGVPENLQKLDNFSKEKFNKVAPIVQEKVSNGKEAREAIEAGEFDYFFEEPKYDPQDLNWKETSPETTLKHLQYAREALDSLQESEFVAENIKDAVWDYASEQGRGEVLWPVRYALSGREKSPDPFEIAGILGKNEAIQRLEKALEILNTK